MNNPEFVEIDGKKYKINTDYRVALKCQEIAQDKSISDYERALGIIYLLYGDAGYDDFENHEKLLDLAVKYLACGNEIEEDTEEPNMDFKQDFNLICASFKSDYGINLKTEKMHWWDFYMYLNGLTPNCILNRIRDFRDYDPSEIEDSKKRNEVIKQQRKIALKKEEQEFSDKQKESINRFLELTKNRKE